MISISVKYKVKKDNLEEVKKAIEEFVTEVKNEPGVLSYNAFQEEDISFVHFITFKDDMAKKSHENSVHVRKFVDFLYPVCEEEPVFNNLNLVKSNKI